MAGARVRTQRVKSGRPARAPGIRQTGGPAVARAMRKRAVRLGLAMPVQAVASFVAAVETSLRAVARIVAMPALARAELSD